MAGDVNTPQYWDSIYTKPDNPGWVLGHPAPPLVQWLDLQRPIPGRVAVLGCGYGDDALLFAQRGFNAVGYDFSERAIACAKTRAASLPAWAKAEFVCADFFDLPRTQAKSFDYVYEYTSFVAIDPARRAEYAKMTHALLRLGGMLVGCFYNHGRAGGPPFDTTREDVLRYFTPLFDIRKLEVSAHSIERRKGHELWAELVKI